MSQFPQDSSSEPPHLGRYEILGEIASGGMATVFLARSVGAGGFSRLMAIKRLHPHLETDDDFVRMFLDEARLAARIRHPNVVATLDVEDEDGLYIVMEYIEGVTLQHLTRAAAKMGERVPIPVAARIALDILGGLHAAHELRDENDNFLNLVHRDVSPQNVLLGTDGAARLTDFGIAKAASRLSMTRDGQLKGKISYMAPEQTRKGEVDRRADVFAMGVVVWEVLAGRRLFSGETDVEVLNQLLFEPIPRLRDHAPSLPSMLEQTVMRALERDANMRYPSASQFADAIERATRMLGGPANHRVVAAFVQKVAGERVARERARIAAGSPITESGSTGSYKSIDSSGPANSRVRASNSGPIPDRAFEPMNAKSRPMRSPTMTGPIYAPDPLPERPSYAPSDRPSYAPRAPRRTSHLRPPTMPAPGTPMQQTHDSGAFKSTLIGVAPPNASSAPPPIIEFDTSEEPTVTRSSLRSRTPPPIAPSQPSEPNTSIDHDEVTRVDSQRLPSPIEPSDHGAAGATVSTPVSMLFGPPPARASTRPPPAPSSGRPPPLPSSNPPPQPTSEPTPAPPPSASPVAIVNELDLEPVESPRAQPEVATRPAQVAPAAIPIAPAPAPPRVGSRVFIGVAMLFAMAAGAVLALYLTGFLNGNRGGAITPDVPHTAVIGPIAARPTPPATPDAAAALPLATEDASVVVADALSLATSDAEALANDASTNAAPDAEVAVMRHDADAGELASNDASTEAPATTGHSSGGWHRHHRHRHGDGGADEPAATTPTTTPEVTAPTPAAQAPAHPVEAPQGAPITDVP